MNALVNFLWLICIVFLVNLLIADYTYQGKHINDDKNQQLKTFIVEIKQDEKFNPVFQQKLSYFSQDGKISNSEFDDLKGLYEQYKTAQVINDTTFAYRKQQKINMAKEELVITPSLTVLLLSLLPVVVLLVIAISFILAIFICLIDFLRNK